MNSAQLLLQLEIIDACVSYIESLQDQLRAHDPRILDIVYDDEYTVDDKADAETNNNSNSDESTSKNSEPSSLPKPSSSSSSSSSSPDRRNSLRENQRLR
jgi:hypothetical protein